MKYSDILNEKLIVINNGKRNGQIVFLAGGAASGKGWAIAKFIKSEEYRVLDVDAWKKLILNTQDKDVVKLLKRPELKNLNLKNPEDVYKIHNFIKDNKIDVRMQKSIFNSLKQGQEKDLPNIMFDVTLKDSNKVIKLMPQLLEAGYKNEDIHIIWVLTDYEEAKINNAKRERVVPEQVMYNAHKDVKEVFKQIIAGNLPAVSKNYVDGEIYIILNNKEETKLYKPSPFAKQQKEANKDWNKIARDFTYFKLKDKGKSSLDKNVAKKLKILMHQFTPN